MEICHGEREQAKDLGCGACGGSRRALESCGYLGNAPEGGKRISHVNTCRLGILGKGHSKCKGPEVGTRLFEGSKRGREEVREVQGTRLADQARDL